MELHKFDTEEILQMVKKHYIYEGKDPSEIILLLKYKGISPTLIYEAINSIDIEIDKKEKASIKQEIIIGAIFCLIGFTTLKIFENKISYGAFIFGGYQLINGFIRMNKKNKFKTE